MTWDFAEGNPFASSSGTWGPSIEWVSLVLAQWVSGPSGVARQLDAATAVNGVQEPMVATDPPYYDNIGYADLADYFYVWLRRSMGPVHPQLFSTLLTPKSQELVATPYRFGGSKSRAEMFFEHGLGEAFERMRAAQSDRYPLTLFYAFKQAESDAEDLASVLASTGWETMLTGLLAAGFAVTGTWPMRSELGNRPIAAGKNALASSVVLVCRPRDEAAGLATRREFVAALRTELPDALRKLQQGNIAPVDLAQAAIGPGMAVFSRYVKVLEADGSPMRIHTALGLINQALDEVLTEQESEYDALTRWAIAWFDQFGVGEGPSGQAILLTQAKGTALNTLLQERLVASRGGKIRLLRRDDLPENWDPAAERNVTIWELTQHLIKQLELNGDAGAAALLRKVSGLGEIARDLAYRLYTAAERKKWAAEALAYNSLVVAWPEIVRLAAERGSQQSVLL
jgi:putative DNA methylase